MNAPKLYEIKVIDPKMRVFDFYGTAEVPDTQKEITRRDYLEMVMPVYMDRGGPLMDNHTNKHFGKALNYEFVQLEDEDGNLVDGVKIRGKCFDNYDSDDEIWNDIKGGKIAGFSWGGNYSPWEKKFNPDGTIELPPVGVYEWSAIRGYVNGVKREPAVYLAQLAGVSAAKMASVPAGKPFAGYSDFDSCVAANKDKNDPQAYCAAIMRETEKYDYPSRHKKFGDSAEAVGWKSKEGQVARFEQIASFIKEGKSVLDVGAGLGHFQEHLTAKGVKADYTGIDTQDDFVQAANAKGVRVIKADIMEYEQPHDYVVASGTFNTEGSPSLYHALGRMDSLSKEGYCFNFLSSVEEGKGLKAHNPTHVRALLETLGRDNYTITEGTVPGEKMVFVSKTKERIYLRPGEKPPEGAQTQTGPHGGQFYDTSAPSQEKPSAGNGSDSSSPTLKPFTGKGEMRILDGIQDEESTKKLMEYEKLDDRSLWNKYAETQRISSKENDVAAMAVFKRVHDQDDGTIRKAEESFQVPDTSKWQDGKDFFIEPLPNDAMHPNPKAAVLREGKIIVNSDFWEAATPEQKQTVLTHEAYHRHLEQSLPSVGKNITEILAAGRFQFPWDEREKLMRKMDGREETVPDEKMQSSIKKENLAEPERLIADQNHRLGGKAMIAEEAKKASEAPTTKQEGTAVKEEPMPAPAPEAPAPENDPVAVLTERVSALEAQFQELMKSLAGAPSGSPAEMPAEAQKSSPATKSSTTIPARKSMGAPVVSTPRIEGSTSFPEDVPVIEAVASMPWQDIKAKAREIKEKREAM